MNIKTKKLHRFLLQAILMAANLACSAGNALAIGTQDDMVQTLFTSEFRKLDRNGDGMLSSEEASRDNDIGQSFVKADTNGDGKLSAEEYSNFKNAVQQARLKTFLDDSGVTAKVKTELLKDNGIKGLSISVETYRGQVILSGFVDNSQQADRAVQIASGIRGVSAVKNSLIVKDKSASI